MKFGAKSSSRYELKGELGSGAMGVVYRGVDKTTGQEVALKTILDNQDPALLRRFMDECQKLAKLPFHPNLIEIRDVIELEIRGVKKPFLVMPLVRGNSLAAVLAKNKLPAARAVDMILQVLKGLQAAHDGGIIHRDIKPSNIFVLEDDSVKLIDFGLAHSADTPLRSTLGAGTPLYRSPEQLLLKPLTHATDLFSVGVVLYEMLAGRPPFVGKNEEELDDQICRMYPPSIATLNPSVNEATARVLHKSMAKLVNHRFGSAREFGDMLDRAFRNRPVEMLDPARIQPRLRRASEASEKGEIEYARELINDLADEYLDDEIFRLRNQIEQKARQTRVRQLIDTAKARREEGEYGIALRNIQEALELEQDNRAARLMKDEILNAQTEEDVDRWQKIARQHILTFAFDHARDALSHVLEKRPQDKDAQKLMSEIRRLESEYVKARKSKSELYDSAVMDFHRGKISTALGKMKRVLDLDRQSPEPGNADRTSTFERFYREVAAQRETVEAAEAQVKKLEDSEDYGEALRICDEILKQFPEHAVFEGLKLRVEERQRQQLSAFVADVDRKVEAEASLEKKLALLQNARERFPNEQHFSQRFEFVRRRKELVDNILAKAASYEEQTLYSEAISELKSLKDIHPQQPDLDFQIERLERRRAQQELSVRRAEVVEEIEQQIDAGDLPGARERIARARSEFPTDTEWNRLESRADRMAGRAAEVERLFHDGRALHEQGKSQEGFPLLQKALSMDSSNVALRRYLLNALLDSAKSMVHEDWRASEPLVEQALAMEPKHPVALGVRTLIEDSKREDAVSSTLSLVREVEERDPRKAAAMLTEALGKYQNEPRLQQAYTRLTRRLDSTTPVPIAAQSGDEANRPGPVAVAAAREPEALKSSIAAPPRPPFPPESYPKDAYPGDAPTVLVSVRNGEPQIPAPTPTPFRRVPQYVWLTLAAVGLLVLVGGIYTALRKKPTPTKPTFGASVPFEVRTTPPGAKVLVDGEAQGDANAAPILVGAGSHKIAVQLPGYETRSEQVTISSGHAALDWTLNPLAQDFALETNIPTGRIQLDEEPAKETTGGSTQIPALAPGAHTIKFSDGQHELEFTFLGKAGAPASVQSPIRAKGVTAVIVSGFAGRNTIVSNKSGVSIQLDQEAPRMMQQDNVVDLQAQPGTHSLVVKDGDNTWNQQVSFGPETRLSAYVFANVDVGTLTISTQVDGATVLLNNRRIPGLTRNGGRLKLPIKPGAYAISVQKDGFQPPAEQRIEVKRGEETQVSFVLVPVVTTGTLRLTSTPGAEVFLGDKSLGIVPPDGTLEVSGLNPGQVQLRAQHKQYRGESKTIKIVAGANHEELPLTQRAMARLTITGVPTNTRITFHRRGEQTETTWEGGSRELGEGEYLFTAAAPGFVTRRDVSVTLEPGDNKPLDLALQPEQQAVVKQVVNVMAHWPAGGWDQEDGGWWSGTKPVGYLLDQMKGVISFRVESPGENRQRPNKVEWWVSTADDSNYVFFHLDSQKLSCDNFVNGKKIKIGTVTVSKADTHDVRISVSAAAINASIDGGDPLVVQGERDFTKGRFIFNRDSKKKTRIRDFKFEQK